MKRLTRVAMLSITACAVFSAVLPAAPARAADEPAPKYTFVETDDTLLADYLALVATHVQALPVVGTDLTAVMLDMWVDFALDLPTALSEDELAELKAKHAGDARLPQVEYFVRACGEMKYSAALGLDPQSMIDDPSASAWQPLMDAYSAGTADGDTLYILRPYYFKHLASELTARIEALPTELSGEARKAAVGKLCAENEAQERAFVELLACSLPDNAQNWFADAMYLWSLGEIEDAIGMMEIGYMAPENYWPESFPLSAIDDCLERREIPVLPGKLPATPEEREQALAAVGAICELTGQIGVPIRDMVKLKELAKEGEVMLALSGDPSHLDWLAAVYQRMGESRRGGLINLLSTSVSCTICSNAMLMYAEGFDYGEREALISAGGASREIGFNAQAATTMLRSWYPQSALMAGSWNEEIVQALEYSPERIDNADPGLFSLDRDDGVDPVARLARTAKCRSAELMVCQVLRPQFERAERGFWEKGGEE
jgi:hypothetical protein